MPRIPVIIDTDPGVDDALAILLALASPELEILAFIISFGNTDTKSSRLNILKIYQAVSRHLDNHPEDYPRFPNFAPDRKPILAIGADGPLEGELHSAQYFHGRDGLGDITQSHPELDVDTGSFDSQGHPQLQISDKSGVDVALDLIRSEPSRSITYIALGPLTNLALILRADADCLCGRIGQVVCMGGALDVPGNTSPVAEFNFFADPYAVREVITPPTSSTSPTFPLDRFLLLPLDVTTPHELSFPTYKAQIDPTFQSFRVDVTKREPLVHFTSAFFDRTRNVMLEFGKDAMELHDAVAVWCAIDNPPPPEGGTTAMTPRLRAGWRAIRRKFQVERTGEVTRGMLVIDRRDDKGAYAPGSNRAEVQAELERRHFPHIGNYESTALPVQVEVEQPPEETGEREAGVSCIVDTPGLQVLEKLLYERIWGVELL